MSRSNHEAFGVFIAPHLDAAYTLARWIVNNDDEAADVFQDACMKAMKGFSAYRGGSPRSWMLTIVRNTAYNYLRDRKKYREIPFDSEYLSIAADEETNPESRMIRQAGIQEIRDAIEALPAEYRETLVLREEEELSYKEIAAIQNVQIGTVMSRLARSRALLRNALMERKS